MPREGRFLLVLVQLAYHSMKPGREMKLCDPMNNVMFNSVLGQQPRAMRYKGDVYVHEKIRWTRAKRHTEDGCFELVGSRQHSPAQFTVRGYIPTK